MVKYHLVHEIPRIIVKTRLHPNGNYIKTTDAIYYCQDCREATNTFQFHERGVSVKAICIGMVLDDENSNDFLEDLILDFSAIGKNYRKIEKHKKHFRHTVNNIILLEDF
jgi:hypothetical protein